jgi:hypothetical protein
MAGNLLNREQPKKKKTNALFEQTHSETNDDTIIIKKEIKVKNDDEECKTKTVEKENKESTQNLTEEISTEQVTAQTITIIKPQNQTLENNNNIIVEVKKHTELEQYYLNRLDEIRQKIDNPTPIDRLNKRRKYSADTRRNVTFSIREDMAWLIDDIVDDAKIFKGLFHDEVLDMGIRAFIEKYGLKSKDSR